MFTVTYRKIFYMLTGIMLLISIGSIAIFGLNVGVDFTGGSLLEVSYEGNVPDKAAIDSRLSGLSLGNLSLRQAGEKGFILRTKTLTEEERVNILSTLSFGGQYQATQERLTTIGPTIGQELRNKALVAISVVIVMIVLYVAFVFRKVSEPVSSWKYGVITIVSLLHDVVVPVGVVAILGQFLGMQVDALFIMALLAILGYSVNDTIVVFDRVRENLRLNRDLNRKEDFELTVGKSLEQTYGRSINTSFTTALALLALFFLGPQATQDFALIMLVGVIAGAYSSIFLASPLLVTINTWRGNRK
ncbi:protein-export membrane protein SecF [Candidatus Kaiserbacteria bacterium RIFCSPHIGHO2_02_FULL_49_11]|uniref:Protein-export membrane protein SecF n=1 Tax=Candidatus Kaiserbacteria bacterium RIFCSPHIGHO2_02_FULL_49_11 TaxID=1798489 RepID=A0A1F6CZJ4_9BACT|nr:MAG: protein-export membrane protein SecF [Candidatus Kaiserbacteria bacterium RIFCSPHIGHO2_02_FULL_49_11]